MFDFPNSPSVGQQIVEPNGSVAQWDGVKWSNVAGQINSVTPAYNNIGRNLLHNSLFNIQQRGVGPWTANAYTADRWNMAFVSGSMSISIDAISMGNAAAVGDEAAEYQLTNTFTGGSGAGDFTVVLERLEDVRRLSGKTVTLSFWATTGGGILKLGANLAQTFGTGGSPSAAVNVAGQSVTLSASWARYSLTFTIPSVSGKTFGTTRGTDYTQLNFWYSSGTTSASNAGNIGVQSGTIAIWGIQLEVGTVATPLEKIDPQQDWAKCQRFYQIGAVTASIGSASWTATWTNRHSNSFVVTMRVGATMVASNINETNCTGTAVGPISGSTYQHIYNVTGPGAGVASSCNWTASADL